MDNENKIVKCKPGQGKLNRLVAKAQVILLGMGHANRRFKRDYENGTATFTCSDCGTTAFIDINAEIKITGNALDIKCTHSNGEL